MDTMRLDRGEDGIATLTFDATGSPVNLLSDRWQADLAQAVQRLHDEASGLKGVLLQSAKASFCAGMDFNEVLRWREADAAAAFERCEGMQRGLRSLETLGVPVVALLEGDALGGDWELALAAHARFVRDDPAIRLGTPEAVFGLVPGAGGVARTTRLLGLAAAQPLLVEGRLFAPQEALRWGLVQGVAADAATLRSLARDWIDRHPAARQPWDDKGFRLPGGDPSSPTLAAALSLAPAMLQARTRGRLPAPQAVLEAMVEGARVDFDTACRIDARKAAAVMTGAVARHLVEALFFDAKAVRGEPLLDARALSSTAVGQAFAQALQDGEPFVRRLAAGLAGEGAAMLEEGWPGFFVERAARAVGMAVGPLQAMEALSMPRRSWSPERAADLTPQALAALGDRLLRRQAIEAARCLRDGVIARPAEGNVVSILRAGFPAWTGGALRFNAA